MSRTVALVDSAVPLYADGSDHPLRDPSQQLIQAGGVGRVELHASVELIQEYVHVKRRREHPIEKIAERVDLLRVSIRIHPFEEDLIPGMLDLLERHPSLTARDAVHAATALGLGIGLIVSPDKHFDGIDGIRRLDPFDGEVIAELVGELS